MKDDTISRAAAVKALEETKQSDPFNRYEYQNIGIDWSIDAIKALPSAQPELSPCDVCRYYPPSSMDGKPCTICPAEERKKDE